jgi:predicted nucleotidyltransferase
MSTVEERLTALESEVEVLKRRLARGVQPRAWLDDVAGSLEHWPEFEEVLRLGREFRRSAADPPETPVDGT